MPYNTTKRRHSVYSSARNNSSRRPGGNARGNNRGQRRGQYINPDRFVQKAKPIDTPDYVPQNTFADFKVHDLIKQNLTAKGYKIPSAIQDQTIPMGLIGQDIIGIANTGTGKTAAFAVPVLHKLMQDKNSNALIVAPTRELAQQIEDELKSIAKGSGLTGVLLIGGTSMGPQLRDLRNRPRVVIGTPGRIKDHIERKTLKLDIFNVVVLDEVDRMLDMGFIADVRFILSNLHKERQSFFFSATMDAKVQQLIETFSNDPVAVSVKTGETSDNVNQDVIRFRGNMEKIDKLHEVLIQDEVAKIILFDETQRSVERLSNELIARGFKADAIHGGKSQGQRQRALNRFKKNEISILVATDVAARGIDVVDITHVINYSTPQSYQDYSHRVGRAGRAGRPGEALTFVSH
ncbi:MAG: DEAD/DEAH box helicase [Candidatus Saccharibacteria bacterium]|nr:DEAD/DEAH box helicase [Candidatus Saccharibacteria bacterium]